MFSEYLVKYVCIDVVCISTDYTSENPQPENSYLVSSCLTLCVCVCTDGTGLVTMELTGVFVDEQHSSVRLTSVCVCVTHFSTGKHQASI